MVNNPKSKHPVKQPIEKNISKSRPDQRGRTEKTAKKSNTNTEKQSMSSRNQDVATSSTGRYNLDGPLTRRPLRRTSNEDTNGSINTESNHIPMVIPKIEKKDAQSKHVHIARDPRMTGNPIMDRNDEMDDESLAQDSSHLTNDEMEDVNQSNSEMYVEIVKEEIGDSDNEDSNWKTKFLNKENRPESTTAESVIPTEPVIQTVPITPTVRIKSEPVDENDFNPASEQTEDDHNSMDSNSTVGLLSPARQACLSSPSSPLKTSADVPTTPGISNEIEAYAIAPEELFSTNHTNSEEEENDSVSENEFPATTPSVYYSSPLDLEQEYEQLEKEKAEKEAAEVEAAVTLKMQGYSGNHDDLDESSDEEMQTLSANIANQCCNNDDDGDDDDSETLSDPSWVNSEPAEDIRSGQKRPLPFDKISDMNEVTNIPAKKNKFQIDRITQDSADSVMEGSSPVEDVAFSAARSPVEQPQSFEMESEVSSAQLVTSEDNDQPPNRTRIPVKLTTTNRASMLVQDYLSSAETIAAKVTNKRAQTPTKFTPKKNKHPSGDRSTPPPPTPSTSFDFSDNVSGVHDIRENNLPRLNNLGSTSSIRDPRVRTRMENEASSSSMDQSTTSSNEIANLSHALKIKILTRILKLWQFKWIKEQADNKEPPPLLKEDDKLKEEIPKLSCAPVLTTYSDFQSYWDIFQPLLLHEMWSSLVLQNQDRIYSDWKCLITKTTEEGNFHILQCTLLLVSERKAPAVNDLIIFTFSRVTGKLIYPFGFVESVKITKNIKISDFDRNLMPKNKSEVKYSAEMVIRIMKNYAPKSYAPGQKDMIVSLAKVTSLTRFMNLFHAQAAFNFSPLRNIVLKPYPSALAFQITSSPLLFSMEYMDRTQTEASFKIAQTMLMSSKNDETKIAMLQGYPGTGKTHVIVNIIRQLTGYKILYCAPTNAAVDEMTRRLQRCNRGDDSNTPCFNVLRMGSWERIHQDAKKVTLEDKLARLRSSIKSENPTRKKIKSLYKKLGLQQDLKDSITKELHQDSHSLQRSSDLEDKLNEANQDIKITTTELENTKKVQEEEIEKDFQDYKRQIICQADVICATLETCSSTDMKNLFLDCKCDSKGQIPKPFLCCIIDDASLCTEPETLIPLALGIKKLILVGDIELLPFSLNSLVAKESRLDQSLFSRFHSYLTIHCQENESPIFKLETQYRMDPEICQWISKYYYGNRLASGKLEVKSPLHAFRVLDVRDSLEIRDGSGFVNHPEAEVILKILECMFLSPDMMAKRNIGIITFYNQQRNFISTRIKQLKEKLKIPDDYPGTIDVRLVHDLQGTEMDIVIISCVKTEIRDKDENLKILTDHWNVALTRASESLFICGSLKTLQTNEVLKDLVSDAEKRQIIHRVTSKFERSMLYDTLVKPEE